MAGIGCALLLCLAILGWLSWIARGATDGWDVPDLDEDQDQ